MKHLVSCHSEQWCAANDVRFLQSVQKFTFAVTCMGAAIVKGIHLLSSSLRSCGNKRRLPLTIATMPMPWICKIFRFRKIGRIRKMKQSGVPYTSIYERVTQKIITQLEQGVVPWKPSHVAKVGFPRNFKTQHFYQGANVFLLGMNGYASPWFLTYVQAKEMGGHVRKGEKGHLIIKYGTFEPRDTLDDEEIKRRGYLRAYTVFNASQIEGVEFPEPACFSEWSSSEKTHKAQWIVDNMPKAPVIREGRKATPYYVPDTDTVEMPDRRYFQSEEHYYSTLFHELAHSTGHESRLARKTLMENASINSTSQREKKIYGLEELVAEMGSAFLCAHAHIANDALERESASYLQGWLNVLKVKQNQKWIVQAAAHAQKAADYILMNNPVYSSARNDTNRDKEIRQVKPYVQDFAKERLSQSSPLPCDFKVGDVVTFTNEYGISFEGLTVMGFLESELKERFIYLNTDAYWFPHKPSELVLEHRPGYE